MKNETETLKYLRDILEESVEVSKPSREEAVDAYEYERGNQLPPDVHSILADRGQPSRWENLYKMIGNKISGMKAMTKQEVTVFPRRAGEREIADVLTKVLRSFMDSTEWWSIKKRADRDLRLSGLSVVEVKLRYLDEKDDAGEIIKDLEYEHLPTNECFIDMYSKKTDLSDSRYFTHSKLLHIKSLKRIFPNAKLSGAGANKAGMIRTNRTWYKDENNNIRFAIWIDDEILQDIQLPFTLLPRFPLAMRKLYTSNRKEFYGMFRDVRPLQDMINNTFLRIINMLGSSKLIIESDAADDIEAWTDHYNEDNSVNVVKPGSVREKKIQDISQNAPLSQLLSIVQDARLQAEKVIGLNSELLGTAISRMSGYAIENRQNAGLVGLQDYMDCSGALDVDIAEISIKIMQEHFTAEQMLLISGKDGEKEQIVINEYERNNNGSIKRDEKQKPKRKSILNIGRYDLILVSSPFARGASAERSKNWAEIMKILQTAEPGLVAPMLPLMLRDVDSPEADEATKIIAELKKQQAQNKEGQQDPALQKAMLEIEKIQAQIAELVSQAQLNTAKAKSTEKKTEEESGAN